MPTLRAVAIWMVVGAVASAGARQLTGSISGVITDTTGRALPGATITVASEPGAVRTAVTDPNGRYEVDGLRPGRHRIEATMNGFDTKIGSVSVSSRGEAVWSGALLVAPRFGEGSMEQKVMRSTGRDAVDCGRHNAAAPEIVLRHSLTCAMTLARAQQPFSVIVQSAGGGARLGHGLLAGADGVIHIFQYDRGRLGFRLRPCSSPDVTRGSSGQGFEFTCRSAQAQPGGAEMAVDAAMR